MIVGHSTIGNRISQNRWIAIFIAFALGAVAMVCSSVQAQESSGQVSLAAGNDMQTSASAKKKLSTFSGQASGPVSISEGPCAGSTCNGGDFCFCWTMSSVPLSSKAIGNKSTLSFGLNEIASQGIPNGSDSNLVPTSGKATIMASDGSRLDVELNGWVGFMGESIFSESPMSYVFTGGTGRFASASGAGSFMMGGKTTSDTTKDAMVSMSGVIQK
jgi:hypothetical protein